MGKAMRSKEEILYDIEEGLASGSLTEADLSRFLGAEPIVSAPVSTAAMEVPQPPVEEKSDRLSAVDVMFYVAGFVLYSAIMSIIVQSWNDGNPFTHILLSAGIGAILWSLAYYLIVGKLQSDTRKGLVNALLLTGSLTLVTGGYIVTNEIIGGFNEVNFVPSAFALLVLAGIHIGFDRLVKRDLPLLLGIFLGVAALPTLLFGILQEAEVALDVWTGIFIVTALLLAAATHTIGRFYLDRPKIQDAFDPLAAFVGLLAMYVASFGEYGVLWQVLLISSVFGIFYLSIIAQNKHLLGNGSFFLVLAVITISFRYFSGYSVTISLIVATLGLLGTAAIAASINRKYFKQPKAAAANPAVTPLPPTPPQA